MGFEGIRIGGKSILGGPVSVPRREIRSRRFHLTSHDAAQLRRRMEENPPSNLTIRRVPNDSEGQLGDTPMEKRSPDES